MWGDKSSLNHISYKQHFYLTQALIICMAFITDKQKEENKDGNTVFDHKIASVKPLDQSGPEVIFSSSTQLGIKFIKLIK